jgi:phosphinothricin acetyltransferase
VAALLRRGEECGFRQVFAVIGDSENVGSIGLHVSLGFRQVGVCARPARSSAAGWTW